MIGFSPFDIFILLADPIERALKGLDAAFAAFGPTAWIGAFGCAIVATTLIIRTILIPLFVWQIKTSRKMQADQALLGPQMQKLRREYKGDPSGLNTAMQALYREHNISPLGQLSGCLPLLVQMPVLYGLYNGINRASHASDLHSGLSFLGIGDMTQSVWSLGGWSHPGLFILPLLAGLATYMTSAMMMPPPRPNMSAQEKQMQGISRTMTKVMPAFVAVLATNYAQGIALYWVTQSTFMVVQQYFMIGWGSMPIPRWLPGASRQGPLHLSRHEPKPRPSLDPTSNGAGGTVPVAGRTGGTLTGGNGRARRDPVAVKGGSSKGAQRRRSPDRGRHG